MAINLPEFKYDELNFEMEMQLTMTCYTEYLFLNCEQELDSFSYFSRFPFTPSIFFLVSQSKYLNVS